MKEVNSEQKKKILKVIGYIILIFIAYLFGSHGIQALMGKQQFLDLVMNIGFPKTSARALLIIVGLIDLSVALALLTYQRTWIFIYAALWPIVPTILNNLNSGHAHWIEVLLIPLLLYFAYKVFIKEKDRSKV